MHRACPGYSLALLTDLYQLTMAAGYWKRGEQDREAVFHLFFRSNPFGGSFAIAAGLAAAIDFLTAFSFDDDAVRYLSSIPGRDGEPLFEPEFLRFLRRFQFSCDVDAVPEGTAVFAHEPLVRVRGPILQAQIIESALLNLVNFSTLVATKSSRICQAAGDDAVLEFGLRRAQGIDGALTASRAAYIGGCSATSNVLAGRLYGIPVRGTHAHSWVMCFESELEAFKAYAEVMPNNCVFLVDTYDTLTGLEHAIEAGKWLRRRGQEMVGVRLDSGDLAALSIAARKILDDAGFTEAAIVASNDLDEYAIEELKKRGACVGVWGVGTRLVTGHDQPALGGVYKLGALGRDERDEEGWRYVVKSSDDTAKASIPGVQQVRRYHRDGRLVADCIYNETSPAPRLRRLVPLAGGDAWEVPAEGVEAADLLVPVFRGGELVYHAPALTDVRQRARRQRELLGGNRGSAHPNRCVGLAEDLAELRALLQGAHGT